jgi:hypothetical protein
MDYQITCVSHRLVYIRWFRESDDPSAEAQFLDDLKYVLDSASGPVYTLSDLRDGRIDDVETVRKLAELTTSHPNYAGGTAFSQDAYTSMFVGLFSRYSHHTRRTSELWPTFEMALNFLETLAPGITQDIDWESLLSPVA